MMPVIGVVLVLVVLATWAYDRRARRHREGPGPAPGDRVDRARDEGYGWSTGGRFPGGMQGPGAGTGGGAG